MYECNICDFATPLKYNYKQHCNSKKHLDKSLSCLKCNIIYKNRSSLLRHIKICNKSDDDSSKDIKIQQLESKIEHDTILSKKDMQLKEAEIKLKEAEMALKMKDLEAEKEKIRMEGENIRILAENERIKIEAKLQTELAVTQSNNRDMKHHIHNIGKSYKSMTAIEYLSTYYEVVPNFEKKNFKELTFEVIEEAARKGGYEGIKHVATELFINVDRENRNVFSSDVSRSKYLIYQEDDWKDDIDGLIFGKEFFPYMTEKIADYICHWNLIHASTTSEIEKRDISERILANAYKLLVYIKENKEKAITALCSKFKLIKVNPYKTGQLKITNISSIDVSSKSKLLIEARKVPVVDPDPNGEKEYDDAEQTRVAKQAEKEIQETKRRLVILFYPICTKL
jgi:hypothetical protein